MSMRIRELRKKKNLTGEQLGDMVGITKGYVSELESGKNTPGGKLLAALAQALGVRVYELFLDADDGKQAEILAHLSVMERLPDHHRIAIETAAIGLLQQQESSDKS